MSTRISALLFHAVASLFRTSSGSLNRGNNSISHATQIPSACGTCGRSVPSCSRRSFRATTLCHRGGALKNGTEYRYTSYRYEKASPGYGRRTKYIFGVSIPLLDQPEVTCTLTTVCSKPAVIHRPVLDRSIAVSVCNRRHTAVSYKA